MAQIYTMGDGVKSSLAWAQGDSQPAPHSPTEGPPWWVKIVVGDLWHPLRSSTSLGFYHPSPLWRQRSVGAPAPPDTGLQQPPTNPQAHCGLHRWKASCG